MNKKSKLLIIALVAAAMVGIYVNETNKGPDLDAHDHSVSQLAILNEALDDDIPILIEFVTHT